MSKLIADIDLRLWFKHLGCTGKHFLLGNPHTVAGRMMAWCPKTERSIFVSKADIGSTSLLARYWIEGFLHGSEPEPPAGKDGPPDFESKKYKDWQRRTEEFRLSGTWNRQNRRAVSVSLTD